MGCWHCLFARVDALMKESRKALIRGDTALGLRMLHKSQVLNRELVNALANHRETDPLPPVMIMLEKN